MHAAMILPADDRDLVLSAPLIAAGVSVRPRRKEDEEFLGALYYSVRAAELGGSGWNEQQKYAFLHQQFTLQTKHYDANYPGLWHGIVERGGRAVGRLYLWRQSHDVRVVDISLLPEMRGRGIGGELLGCVQAEAVAHGRTVSLHVDLANPAQHLYQRLGFQPDGPPKFPYQYMVWQPT